MTQIMDLLDKIDEVRASRVTPEKFEQTWGYSLEHHAKRMMDFIHNLEGKADQAEEPKCNPTADEVQQPSADHDVDSAVSTPKKYVLFISFKNRKEEKTYVEISLKMIGMLKEAFEEYELASWMSEEREEPARQDMVEEELAETLKSCQERIVRKGMMLMLDMDEVDQDEDRARIRTKVDGFLTKHCIPHQVEEIDHGDIPVLGLSFKSRIRNKHKERAK